MITPPLHRAACIVVGAAAGAGSTVLAVLGRRWEQRRAARWSAYANAVAAEIQARADRPRT